MGKLFVNVLEMRVERVKDPSLAVLGSLLHEGFLELQRVGATLHCGVWASLYGGFSCYGAQPLEHTDFHGCGAQA